MTNQKLWESQFAFDEIRPDRDSLYSIVELLDETYFTLDVQEKNIWITNFMMHDIARPMKDLLHYRPLLPMKNFFGTVGSVRQQFEKARYEFVNLYRFLINMEMFLPDYV